jgi:RNA polymerase sigma-70 factor (ECF subfamily)
MAEFDRRREFMPWAYRIARYQIMAHFKTVARQRRVFSEGMLQQIAQRIEERQTKAGGLVANTDQMEALESCLEKLPQRQREYVDLRYRQSLSVRDIAARLAATENTVLTMLSRARLALGRCVKAAMEGRP